MWGECWFGPVAHLIYGPNKAGYKASAIASVRRFIAAMAIATRSERSMDRITPPRPPSKERAIPPPDKSRGHPGAVLVKVTDTSLYTPQNVQKAVTFFTQANLSRLLVKLREKYIEVGRVGGQVLLEDTTLIERREIASFLTRPPYAGKSLKVKLVDVEKVLRHSFGCSLPDLLVAFFPDKPLVTRQAKREAQAIHQVDFRNGLLSIASTLPDGSQGKYWLQHGQHGQEWIFSRFKNSPADEQERQLKLVRYTVNVLNQLPKPDAPERLALFSQRTCGDPHALDPNMAAGRLLLLALHDLAQGLEASSSQLTKTPQDRERELHCTKMQVCLSIRYHQVWQPSISQAQYFIMIYLIHLFRLQGNAYFSSQCDSCLNGSALLLRAQRFTCLRTHRYLRRLLQP